MTASTLNAQTNGRSNEKCLSKTLRNLDVYTDLFKRCNVEIEKSQAATNDNGNYFEAIYRQCSSGDYKENTIGECLITNIENLPKNYCHINDLKQ